MLSAEEQQSIRKALLKVPTDGWRHVGEHTDEMGNTSNWIVAGDYANEGEPDLVIEVWGTEDDSAYADFVAASRYLVPKLLDYIDELESMPLVHDVVEQKQEIERLSEEIESWKSSMASTVNSTGSYISNLEIENKQLRETLLEIQIESSCDGAGRTLNRINDIVSKAFNQRESKPEITRHALEDDAHATL